MAEREKSVDRGADRGNDGATGRSGGEAEPTRGGGILGIAMMPVLVVASLASKAWDALTRDGTLAAAGRQGADELGMALNAFPPGSIQASEPGTLWSPTQGEIAASRDQGSHFGNYSSYSHSSQPPHPWPSEIARANQNQPGQDRGQDHGQERDAGMSL